jgi:transposase
VSVVGGIDIHRSQLTFDYVDLDSGEVFRGRIAPGDRVTLRRWLQRFTDRRGVAFALEGCTGWRYVVEELQRKNSKTTTPKDQNPAPGLDTAPLLQG